MDTLIDLIVFLLEVSILAVAVVAVVTAIMAAGMRARREANRGNIVVTHLNREYERMRDTLRQQVYDRFAFRQLKKDEKRKRKAERQEKKKQASHQKRDRSVFVINFKGDLAATQLESLRQEVSTILSLATDEDEVILRLESPGGMVHGYGLAASQLQRIRQRGVPLTICVDRMAASGGYMMACLADRLVAAPFAVLGSIGVLMQVPNFHRVLKNHDVEFEMITAGEFKRTLTLFGETTQKARNKVQEDVEEIHTLFKNWVSEYRPALDIDAVATGETWFGSQALENHLADEIGTSDDVIMKACETARVYEVRYEQRKNLGEKIGKTTSRVIEKTALDWIQRLRVSRYF
ncbi:MAG: protease SohB [Pseudomonadota bacterium]